MFLLFPIYLIYLYKNLKQANNPRHDNDEVFFFILCVLFILLKKKLSFYCTECEFKCAMTKVDEYKSTKHF